MSPQIRCRGEVRVALPPERAIHAFTALGEREWAPGWDPVFPAGDAGEAGTVFTTAAAYALTALGPDAGLDAFAAGFDDMLATWERLIGEAAGRF